MSEHLCKTCVHARWEMTAHDPPRINTKVSGRCHAPIDREAILALIPTAIAEEYWTSRSLDKALSTRSAVIWVDSPIKSCPLYQPKDTP